jgi:hypothetical protein
MPQFDLETITTWTLDETRAAITLLLPEGWTHTVFEQDDGVWGVEIYDVESTEIWADSHPDLKLVLLNAYGFLWRRSYVPSNPMWQRRRDDLREVARRGMMHVPGAEDLPDPEDFDPDSVYGLDSKGKPTT